MQDIRLMLLAIFSKDAALERVAGIKGVVQLLLQYISYDEKWLKWQQTLRRNIYSPHHAFILTIIEKDTRSMDHFLKRLSYYPRVSMAEVDTALCLIDFIKRVHTINWEVNLIFYRDLLTRIFLLFKNAPFSNHILTQEVFKAQGFFYYQGRFPQKEVYKMDYAKLANEGIDIVKIHDDFRGCDAVLTNSRHEWLNTHLRITNDYPFRSPTVLFPGTLRPKRFSKRESITIDQHYDYGFCAVEDSLRAILLELEMNGVISVLDPSSKVIFL
jgi:hypothetical protein